MFTYTHLSQTLTHTHTHTSTYTYTQTHTHAYTHTYMHTYMHTHTLTHQKSLGSVRKRRREVFHVRLRRRHIALQHIGICRGCFLYKNTQWCSVWQYVLVCMHLLASDQIWLLSMPECAAYFGKHAQNVCKHAYCSVLQCVAVRCSVSRCVAVCRGVMQCVAVCCRGRSVLQCVCSVSIGSKLNIAVSN